MPTQNLITIRCTCQAQAKDRYLPTFAEHPPVTMTCEEWEEAQTMERFGTVAHYNPHTRTTHVGDSEVMTYCGREVPSDWTTANAGCWFSSREGELCLSCSRTVEVLMETHAGVR